MFVHTTESEMERLRIAKETGKYGHLMSWKELFLFQRYVAKPNQAKEIARWAKRKNKGEKIYLPLMHNRVQETL